MDTQVDMLNREQQQQLGQVARFAIERGFAGKGPINSPEAMSTDDTALCQPLGAFVTLNLHGNLRGCIGTMQTQSPLSFTVARMAYAAAFQDHRFAPLSPEEWPLCHLEISVLGPLSPCPGPEHITIGRHGLILAHAGKSGVFLPQVPVEQGWDVAAYLEHLCAKAALPPDSWKAAGAQLYWYEAFVFAPPLSG